LLLLNSHAFFRSKVTWKSAGWNSIDDRPEIDEHFGLQRDYMAEELTVPETVWFPFYCAHMLPIAVQPSVKTVTFPPWALTWLIHAVLEFRKSPKYSNGSGSFDQFIHNWLNKQCPTNEEGETIREAVLSHVCQLQSCDVVVVSSWLFVMSAPIPEKFPRLTYAQWFEPAACCALPGAFTVMNS
jgi:hypothetical protein